MPKNKPIDFIFENKYAYIIHKDKSGVFPETDFDNLKNKVIKVQLLKESQKKYALPLVEDDYIRQFYMNENIIKAGIKEIGYFWKNKRLGYAPLFILKIEKIPKDQKFIKLSDKQIYSEEGYTPKSDYYLLSGYTYVFTFFKTENSWFIIFDNVNRAYGEHVEIKFVPERTDEIYF